MLITLTHKHSHHKCKKKKKKENTIPFALNEAVQIAEEAKKRLTSADKGCLMSQKFPQRAPLSMRANRNLLPDDNVCSFIHITEKDILIFSDLHLLGIGHNFK